MVPSRELLTICRALDGLRNSPVISCKCPDFSCAVPFVGEAEENDESVDTSWPVVVENILMEEYEGTKKKLRSKV